MRLMHRYRRPVKPPTAHQAAASLRHTSRQGPKEIPRMLTAKHNVAEQLLGGSAARSMQARRKAGA